MRILLATTFLNCLSGSELFLFDLARGLRRRGHDVTVWVRDLVPTAPLPRLLTLDGVRMVDELPPDGTADAVVFQLKETFQAFAERHLEVPRFAVCHGPKLPAEVAPVGYPRVTQLALTHEGARWLADEGHERIVFTGYGIDLDRFSEAEALPERPRRAVVHSKYANLDLVREACARAGVELAELGATSWRGGFDVDHFSDIVEVRDDGTVIDHRPEIAGFHVERTIARADIVFGLGRSAVEALAMGRACVVFGYDSVGDGMITHDRLPRFAEVNFSGRARAEAFDPDSLAGELRAYDPAQGRRNRAFCERHYSLERFLDRVEGLLPRQRRPNGRVSAALRRLRLSPRAGRLHRRTRAPAR
jgi:glycosyltransferase involved in cell wall biosynthesis